MSGISSIGAYLPRARLTRAAIASAMGWLSPGLSEKGSRTLAFWDEDSTTMAVAAARACLTRPNFAENIRALDLCSLTPPFAERQNASILHAALRLPASCTTQESGTIARATLIALHRAMISGQPGLIVGTDRPVMPPGSAAESRAGDGAAAVTTNLGPDALHYLGGANRTDAMAERYRASSAQFATEWEDRWVREVGWQGVVAQTISDALSDAEIAADTVDHLILATTLPRLAKTVAKTAGLTKARIADDLGAEIGDTGSAQALMMLAAIAPQIAAGHTVLIAGFGQGATALIFRATNHLCELKTGFCETHAAGIPETSYTKLPIFTGLMPWDPGKRGHTSLMEALTTAERHSDALLSFTGGRCRDTGVVQFPPSRISANRQAHLTDTQDLWPLADLGGTVASHTVDTLAFSRNPPSCYGLVDINGGGRLMMDFTDPDATDIGTGAPVRFVFRVKDMDPATGFRRYFWKAVKPLPSSVQIKKEHADAQRA